MYTNNWNNYVSCLITGNDYKGRDLKGTDISNVSSSNTSGVFKNEGNVFIICGTGNTQPQKKDYKLESEISDLTRVSVSRKAPNSGEDYDIKDNVYSNTTTYKNNTDNEIIVSEIGLITSLSSNSYLMAREVLANPVTIESGKSYAFTMSLGL